MRALAVAMAMLAASQEVQPPRATFKSAVDLVPVDVSVVDRNGRPVPDLTPQDFTLSVDGKPRQIASAEFISIAATPEAVPARTVEYSSNAGAAGGRLIMLVVDAESIGIGRGRTAFQAARRYIGTLNRADRVALVVLPNVGPQVEFTTNHALVQSLLDKVAGHGTDDLGPRRVGLSEALALQGNDRSVGREVVARECGTETATTLIDSCLQRIQGEAAQLLLSVRERSRNSLVVLRGLFDRMDTGNTPKTIVLISEGMLLDSVGDLSWVGARASSAHIILYVLQLDTSEIDASSQRLSPSQSADRTVLKQGLDQLAAQARGDVFRIFGDADFAFQRLGRELSGYYLLSFNPEPGDRDGTPHKIRIEVRRPNLELRSRREFSVGPPVALTTDDLVRQALRTPILAADIPLKLTTYTFQDPGSSRLKILLAVEIDRSLNPQENVSLGYVMLDDMGQPGASRLEKTVATPIDALRRVQQWAGAAVALPGRTYTVKVAVVDDSGRRGSVERTITAKLNGFGQLHATDLLLADNTPQNAGDAPPPVAADLTGDELYSYLELLSEVAEQLTNATVVIEIAQSEAGSAIASAPARLQAAESAGGRRRIAEAGLPIGLLPPGEYVARAVISVSGRKVGQVIRPFRVSRAGPVVAVRAGSTAPLKSAAPIAFASRMDAFDKSAVLTPQVLGFFLERLSATAAADAAALRPALESARAGKLDDAVQALKGTGDDGLAAVFLKGLLSLSRSDLKGAEAGFREALRLDSEFLPAAFYLGACLAAAGRDRDAAGAWQTALITESNAPFVYTLLGDALLRLGNVEQAIDVLMEARTLWPSDHEVGVRLATALVRVNKQADALKVLQPYLEAHPADQEWLFLAMRALYEARAARRVIETADADKARFVKYADAYSAARGSQQALVDQWRKYFESPR
jgi:VWFA-related protein